MQLLTGQCSVNVGLNKLNQAAQDIKQMKVQLKAEEKKLQESEVQTNQLLAKVQSESAKAEKKSQGVSISGTAMRAHCIRSVHTFFSGRCRGE